MELLGGKGVAQNYAKGKVEGCSPYYHYEETTKKQELFFGDGKKRKTGKKGAMPPVSYEKICITGWVKDLGARIPFKEREACAWGSLNGLESEKKKKGWLGQPRNFNLPSGRNNLQRQ